MSYNVKVYDKELEGTVKLSANFKVSEFACKDGARMVFVSDELVKILQETRDHFRRALIINSGYRTPAHNVKVGGVKASPHMMGIAADIRIPGIDPLDVYSWLDKRMGETGGVGRYNTFTHIDVRVKKSRWRG